MLEGKNLISQYYRLTSPDFMKIQYTSVDLSQSDMRLTSNEKITEVEERPLLRSSRSSSVRYRLLIF